LIKKANVRSIIDHPNTLNGLLNLLIIKNR